jgi:hypothetical protein
VQVWRGWIAAALLIALALTGGPDAIDTAAAAPQGGVTAGAIAEQHRLTAAQHSLAAQHDAADQRSLADRHDITVQHGSAQRPGTPIQRGTATRRTTAIQRATSAQPGTGTQRDAIEQYGGPEQRTEQHGTIAQRTLANKYGLGEWRGLQVRDDDVDVRHQIADRSAPGHLRLPALPPSPQNAVSAPLKGAVLVAPPAPLPAVADGGGRLHLDACTPEALQIFRC